MFTVLIAEQQHIDAIRQENSLFFEPFLDNRNFAFCPWTPEGRTLTESVPSLRDVVGRRKEWRAVILHSADPDQLKQQNPFDEVDYSAVTAIPKPNPQPADDERWEDWVSSWEEYYRALMPKKEAVFRSAFRLPLQRLATWLCFRPADYILDDVAEKQDVEQWAMEILEAGDLKPSEKLENMERDQYRKELRLKELLRREFIGGDSINIAFPTEICCISQRITEHGFFHPDSYWNIRSGTDYSAFVDRNMYFDKMRFLVFDVLPKTHRDYRNDLIRFLYAVLVFVTNPTPSSAMQARKLYVIESENDDSPLVTLVTSFERKLTATSEVIENEIEKIRSEIPGDLTDREAEALFCAPSDVPVTLDKSCDESALFVEDNLGLSSDCPEDEKRTFARGYAAAKRSMVYIVKQQARSVRRGVNKVEDLSRVDGRDVSRLTSFQIDDVREYTEEAEDVLATQIPPDFSEISRYSEPMEEKAAEVRKVLEQRMSRKTTIVLGAICLGLFLVCLLPMLFTNMADARSTSTALVLVLAVLGAVGLILFISLFFLRKPMRSALRDFNNQMQDSLNDVKTALQQFSTYLSAVCNVRRGNAVMKISETNVDEYTRSIRIRKMHQEDLRRRRAYLLEDYRDFLGDKSCCDESMSQPYEYDFGQKTEYSYPAPFLAGDFRQIEFLVAGNYITVPSSFATRILIRMEEIYDK